MIRKTISYIAVFLSLVCFASSVLGVSASTTSNQLPYESYTYWEDISEERKAVYSRPIYDTAMVIDALSLGIEPFTTINDVYSNDKFVYVLDNASRIVILDNTYKFVREIKQVTDSDKNIYDYTGAQSLYVHTDDSIFISDTENQRVIRINSNGKLMDVYEAPVSSLIPESFVYKPLRAVMDSHGYLYVLSDGSYYGALLYAPDKPLQVSMAQMTLQQVSQPLFKILLKEFFLTMLNKAQVLELYLIHSLISL